MLRLIKSEPGHKTGGGGKQPVQRPNLLIRLLLFVITAALVLGAVALILNYDKLNFDGVRRWFAYRDLTLADNGQAESFPYDGDGTSLFANVGGDLLVCSSTGVWLYSGSGQVYVSRTITMNHPVAVAKGNTALAYDAGGRVLLAFRDRTEIFSLELEEEEQLISADLNDVGWMVVVTQKSGYKGVVTIYDSQFQPQMQISLSSRFVMDAALSPDSGKVALLTMDVKEGTFASTVELYPLGGSLEEAQPQDSYPVGSETVLEMTWDKEGIWALGESTLYRLNGSAVLMGGYSYAGRYLKGFSLEGDGTAALLLGKYRAGSAAELVVVDGRGEAQATLSLDEQVLSISAAGRYVALLTANRLDIYDQDLDLYNSLESTQSARKVLQRADGSAMLMDSSTARLYLPQ